MRYEDVAVARKQQCRKHDDSGRPVRGRRRRRTKATPGLRVTMLTLCCREKAVSRKEPCGFRQDPKTYLFAGQSKRLRVRRVYVIARYKSTFTYLLTSMGKVLFGGWDVVFSRPPLGHLSDGQRGCSGSLFCHVDKSHRCIHLEFGGGA